MVLNILLIELCFAARFLEWADHRSHRANLFVPLELTSLDILLVAVVSTPDWVIGAHRVVVSRDDLVCVFGPTELALDTPHVA